MLRFIWFPQWFSSKYNFIPTLKTRNLRSITDELTIALKNTQCLRHSTTSNSYPAFPKMFSQEWPIPLYPQHWYIYHDYKVRKEALMNNMASYFLSSVIKKLGKREHVDSWKGRTTTNLLGNFISVSYLEKKVWDWGSEGNQTVKSTIL